MVASQKNTWRCVDSKIEFLHKGVLRALLRFDKVIGIVPLQRARSIRIIAAKDRKQIGMYRLEFFNDGQFQMMLRYLIEGQDYFVFQTKSEAFLAKTALKASSSFAPALKAVISQKSKPLQSSAQFPLIHQNAFRQQQQTRDEIFVGVDKETPSIPSSGRAEKTKPNARKGLKTVNQSPAISANTSQKIFQETMQEVPSVASGQSNSRKVQHPLQNVAAAGSTRPSASSRGVASTKKRRLQVASASLIQTTKPAKKSKSVSSITQNTTVPTDNEVHDDERTRSQPRRGLKPSGVTTGPPKRAAAERQRPSTAATKARTSVTRKSTKKRQPTPNIPEKQTENNDEDTVKSSAKVLVEKTPCKLSVTHTGCQTENRGENSNTKNGNDQVVSCRDLLSCCNSL